MIFKKYFLESTQGLHLCYQLVSVVEHKAGWDYGIEQKKGGHNKHSK